MLDGESGNRGIAGQSPDGVRADGNLPQDMSVPRPRMQHYNTRMLQPFVYPIKLLVNRLRSQPYLSIGANPEEGPYAQPTQSNRFRFRELQLQPLPCPRMLWHFGVVCIKQDV